MFSTFRFLTLTGFVPLRHASSNKIASQSLREPGYAGADVCLEYVVCHTQIERHRFAVRVTVLIVNAGADQHRVRCYRQSHPGVRSILRPVMRRCQHVRAQRIVE